MTDAGEATGHGEEAALPVSSPPHIVHLANGHTVTLYPKVTVPIGIAALSVVKQGGSQAVIEAGLAEVYLRLGIANWDFTGKDGQREPVNEETLGRLLPYNDGGLEVAEAADALYSEDVFRPLVSRIARLSGSGPTASSTPPSPSIGSTRPVRSARSSRNGTAGKRSGGRAR